MKKFIKILLFGLLCICFNPQNIFAENGNTYAFLCSGSEIDPVPMQNDIDGMATVLKKNKISGNVYVNVYYTTSKSKKTDLNKAMSKIYNNCTTNDIAFFYYTGHGSSNGKGLHINEDTNYTCKSLMQDLNKIHAKKIIVMLDACYSGTFYNYGLNKLKVEDRKKFILFLASNSDETSDFVHKNGKYYSRYSNTLSIGLGREGKVYADSNDDGFVTTEELSSYLDIQMKNQLVHGNESLNWSDVHPVFYSYDKAYPIYKYNLPATIKLNKSSATIYTYGRTSVKLKATLRGTTSSVKWRSSDASIATVDSKGKVTAKKAGIVTITAKSGRLSAKCQIIVQKPSVKLNKTKVTLYGNEIVQLKATVVGASKNVTWISSNSRIAMVDQTGKVTAKKTGAVMITAKANNCKATCLVTVNVSATPDINAEYFNKMPIPQLELMGNGMEYVQINMIINYLDQFVKQYGHEISLVLSDGNIALKTGYDITGGKGTFNNSIYILVQSQSTGRFLWCGTGYYKGKTTILDDAKTLQWELSLPKNSFNMNEIKYVSIEVKTANSRFNVYTYKYDTDSNKLNYYGSQELKTLGVAVSSKGYQHYLE